MNPRRFVKKLLPSSLFRSIEPIGHLVEAAAVTARYGYPAKKLRVIGVTGTNGKTTTSFMIHQMLVAAGYKTALMTTVANGIGKDILPQQAHMTTVSSAKLQRTLLEYKQADVEWVVLETTSHALAQHRVFGVPYEIAVFTNITHEHLDYHRTFARYLQAKQQLFRIANKHPNGFGVVNADDPNADAFVSAIRTSETYGLQAGTLRASEVSLSSDGSEFVASDGKDFYNIHCSIPGEFNISNALAAISVGRHIGLTKNQIEQGISSLTGVEGRMHSIDEGQVFGVIVDFAHTPDSFERLLSDLRRSTKGKLVVVFGSAGRRDESKRAIQGKIAGKYADEIILTEEDDRDVDGGEILRQIATGSEAAGKTKEKDLFLILDRTKAIQFAMSRVQASEDTVVLLGKGHEKTIERADGEHAWDEAATVREAIRSAIG